jgi:hypothetical protein
MASNKDIKELMEARKARRAVPQTDPADVVAIPEPELAAPPVVAPIAEQAPQRSNTSETPVMHHPQDSRYAPAPKDDIFIAKTYKFKSHRFRQLHDEKHFTGTEIQDILDKALGEYFEKRYGTAPNAE